MPQHQLSEFEVLNAIYHRRAVRAYQAQQPDDALIRELLAAAVQAPTAMHLEPWGFVVVQDQAALKRYSDRAKSLLLGPERRRRLGIGRHRRQRAARPRPRRLLADPAFNIFYDAGTLIVVCRAADDAVRRRRLLAGRRRT